MSNPPVPGKAAICCPVCGGGATHFDQAVVLGDVQAHYFKCAQDCCIFTPDPTWLARSYDDALSASDVGCVARSADLAELTSLLLSTVFRGISSCLDYGAGYGMFVRMMRDRGHDFTYWDPYGPNLFAKGFAVDSPTQRPFSCVTAFEVLEHMEQPVEALAPLAASADLMILSTSLVPDSLPALGDWWYYSLETGQHVTLWRPAGIKRLAATLGFHSISIGSLHILSKRRLSQRLVHVLVSTRTRPLTRHLQRGSSLLAADYEVITGKPWPV